MHDVQLRSGTWGGAVVEVAGSHPALPAATGTTGATVAGSAHVVGEAAWRQKLHRHRCRSRVAGDAAAWRQTRGGCLSTINTALKVPQKQNKQVTAGAARVHVDVHVLRDVQATCGSDLTPCSLCQDEEPWIKGKTQLMLNEGSVPFGEEHTRI